MKWEPIEKYKGGPALFYHPPVIGERHPSNNKPAMYSTSRGHIRHATLFAKITPPEPFN